MRVPRLKFQFKSMSTIPVFITSSSPLSRRQTPTKFAITSSPLSLPSLNNIALQRQTGSLKTGASLKTRNSHTTTSPLSCDVLRIVSSPPVSNICASSTVLLDSDEENAPPPSNQEALAAQMEHGLCSSLARKTLELPDEIMAATVLQSDMKSSGDDETLNTKKTPLQSTKQAARLHKQRQKQAAKEKKQAKLGKGKVTKPGVQSGKKQLKITDTISKHFPTSSKTETVESTSTVVINAVLTTRKRDWSPPQEVSLRATTKSQSNSSGDKPQPHKTEHSRLLESFELKNDDTCSLLSDKSPPPVIVDSGAVAKKPRKKRKKKGEEVEGEDSVNAAAATAAASVNKQPVRTLTELATAAYAAEDQLQKKNAPKRKTKKQLVRVPVYDGADKVMIRKGASKFIPKDKPKYSDVAVPLLLPPSQARADAENQLFVFGTSSQLVLEQPDTHSNPELSTNLSADSNTTTNSRVKTTTKRGRLWLASARDEEGSLLEIVDLVDQDEAVYETVPEPTVNASRPEDAVPGDSHTTEPQAAAPIEPAPQRKPKAALPSSTASGPQKPVTSTAATNDNATAVIRQEMPDFGLLTDAQLSLKLTAYGFKPMKRRKAMINLLEECWKSKNTSTASSETHRTDVVESLQPISRETSTGKTTVSPRAGTTKRTSAKQATKISSPAPAGLAVQVDASNTGETVAVKDSSSLTKRRRSPKKSHLPDEQPPPRKKRLSAVSVSSPSSCSDIAMKHVTTAARASKQRTPTVFCVPDSEDDIDGDDYGNDNVGFAVTNHSMPQPTAAHASKPRRARPKKVDVDNKRSPRSSRSRSRSRSRRLSSSPAPLASQTAAITAAITSTPGTTDPQHPSWLEKMVMYQPIIVKELTAWLNAGELSRVGWDVDVTEKDVLTWCNSMSVCSVSEK